jgi:hypothetical protein
LLHVLDGFWYAPDLICVDHEDIAFVETDDLTGDAQALLILGNVAADLELEVPVAFGERFFEKTAHLVFTVAEPAR